MWERERGKGSEEISEGTEGVEKLNKCPKSQTEEAATTPEKDVPGADNRSPYGTEQPERATAASVTQGQIARTALAGRRGGQKDDYVSGMEKGKETRKKKRETHVIVT